MSEQRSLPVDVEVTLARPTHRLGGTVVGTIRVTHRHDGSETDGDDDNDVSERRRRRPQHAPRVASLQLTAAGLVRLDPRWHAAAARTSSSGTKGSRSTSCDGETTLPLPLDFPLPAHTTPFWTAGTIELTDLQERSFGSWEDIRPKPIVLPGRTAPDTRRGSCGVPGLSQDPVNLAERQLAFTFRVDLPRNNPHSLLATSCRYYYLILVRLQTDADSDPEWIVVPVTVLTANTNNSDPADKVVDDDDDDEPKSPRFMQAMAHSSGLPTQLTATELNQFEGQYTVSRQGTALYRNVRGVQSMLVADPATGRPACVLTILGSPSQLVPGSRFTLKLDFPTAGARRDDDGGNDDGGGCGNATPAAAAAAWIPCYQASACLQGEEVALLAGGRSGSGARKRVARRHVFSTAHEAIIDRTTECVPLNLVLPETAPCTVLTDAVEITVQCIVDIAVGTTTAGGNSHNAKVQFRNLRLEIPCHVVHAVADWESSDNDEEAPAGYVAFREIVESLLPEPTSNPRDPRSFQSHDIQDALKILSLQMAEACGLLPQPSGDR